LKRSSYLLRVIKFVHASSTLDRMFQEKITKDQGDCAWFRLWASTNSELK